MHKLVSRKLFYMLNYAAAFIFIFNADNMGAGTLSAVHSLPHEKKQQRTALVARAIADMQLPSEALVIDPQFPWQRQPQVTMHAPRGDAIPSWWRGNRPVWTHAVVPWFTAFEAQGNAARNSRVEVKDLRFFILSNKTRQWQQVELQARPEVKLWQYPFRAAGQACGNTLRMEGPAGISVLPAYPLFLHGWGKPQTIDPEDVAATFTAMEFRLILNDPRKRDDRRRARYVVDVGADYYPDAALRWSLDFAPGIGNGRMLLARPAWRTATLLVPNKDHGVSLDSLLGIPPPALKRGTSAKAAARPHECGAGQSAG
jgi:hypothetical protein